MGGACLGGHEGLLCALPLKPGGGRRQGTPSALGRVERSSVQGAEGQRLALALAISSGSWRAEGAQEDNLLGSHSNQHE